MKRRMSRSAGLVVLLVLAGFFIAASGIISIKASSGHWRITAWFLRFGMHRSFATHSLGVKVPPLDDPALVLKGATHYESGCRSCHGSPDTRQPRIGQSMTPPAPDLRPLIQDWDDAALFTLVKHGVKFTGMPAWPSQQRDDEVWAMVAFLRKLPALDGRGYRELAHGEAPPGIFVRPPGPAATDAAIPAIVSQSCIRCHGADGLGRGSRAFPALAGQHRDYLENALRAYAQGRRHSGIMEPVAANLSDETIRELAAYYASLPRRPHAAADRASPPADVVELGRQIAREGIPAQKIPACIECHGPAGHRMKPLYPSLAGQPADYLELQLRLFKARKRGGGPSAHLMDHVAPHLSPEQMRAVALYFEALTPRADDPEDR